MDGRWYYRHAGRTHGPATADQLRALAAAGELSPADPVWPEGADPAAAVPAQQAVLSPATVPDWLEDVRALEEATSPPAPEAPPGWQDDVQVAEEEAGPLERLAAEELLGEQLPAPKSVPLAVPVAGVCRLVVGGATTAGRERERNEGGLLAQHWAWADQGRRRDIALAVVAGGRAGGLVVRTVGSALTPLPAEALTAQSPEPAPADLADALDNSLREANRVVHEASRADGECRGMTATAVALLVWGDRAFAGLVGDCRVYHWRAGRLTQVTRDQTLVARMVELGQLTPEQAATHPRRGEVAQALGKYALVEPARYEIALAPGDWLVAACDGLHNHVEDRKIREAVGRADRSALGLANHLTELANRGGGDNCTVVAVGCV